jgi:hypothetical protein
MNVVLIAHSGVSKYDDPSGAPFDRLGPKIHKTAAAAVLEWVDEAFFCAFETTERTFEDAKGNEVPRKVGKGVRRMRTQERPSHVAKNRLGDKCPEKLELSWAAYEAQINPQQEA